MRSGVDAVPPPVARANRPAARAACESFGSTTTSAWGLIVGLTLVLLPAFGPLARIGQNLVLFFGMLYALRGLGVIDSFVRRSAVLVAIAAVIAIVNPRPYAAVVALAAILGLFAVLGVSDAWGDWRRRMRAVS